MENARRQLCSVRADHLHNSKWHRGKRVADLIVGQHVNYCLLATLGGRKISGWRASGRVDGTTRSSMRPDPPAVTASRTPTVIDVDDPLTAFSAA